MRKLLARFLSRFGWAIFFCQTLHAVTLTLTPASISNTFTGSVAVAVSGLTNHETILLESFLDLNNNGAVNTNEPLVQRFQITDGNVTSIAGVRNDNIPGDDDGAANGKITVNLRFLGGSEISRLAGNFRLRVSSPGARFANVEQSLAVTQAFYAQSITGKVYAVSSPLTNALVLLQTPSGGFLSGAVADGAGNYKLYAPPGSYQVVAFLPGASAVSDSNSSPIVSLAAGQTKSLNITNSAATRTVSGYVRDSGTGSGIAGVQLLLHSSSNLMTLAFTDKTGFFSAPLTAASDWSISPSLRSLSQLGYLGLSSEVAVGAATGNVSTNLSLPPATSLIYGSLRDESNNPIRFVPLVASDCINFLYGACGLTDSNGAYTVGVQGGYWSVQPDPTYLATLGYLCADFALSPSDAQAVEGNFQARAVISHFKGRVLRDNGGALAGISVNASAMSGFSTTCLTDTNGFYDLGVLDGDWAIRVDDETLQELGLLQPDLPPFSIAAQTTLTNADLVVRRVSGQITGSLLDTNGVAIAGASISAGAVIGGFSYQVSGMTDASGNYLLSVCNGQWGAQADDLTSFGYVTPLPQQTAVSNSTNTVNFVAQPLPPLEMQTAALPDAIVLSPFTFQFQAVGGAPPYWWTIASGSLPPGLSLEPDGTITGTPTQVITNSFTAQVADNLGNFASKTLSLAVKPFPVSLKVASQPSGGQFQLFLSGQQNQDYVLEFTTQLSLPTSWTPIETNRALNGVVSFSDSGATNFSRFYRARKP